MAKENHTPWLFEHDILRLEISKNWYRYRYKAREGGQKNMQLGTSKNGIPKELQTKAKNIENTGNRETKFYLDFWCKCVIHPLWNRKYSPQMHANAYHAHMQRQIVLKSLNFIVQKSRVGPKNGWKCRYPCVRLPPPKKNSLYSGWAAWGLNLWLDKCILPKIADRAVQPCRHSQLQVDQPVLQLEDWSRRLEGGTLLWALGDPGWELRNKAPRYEHKPRCTPRPLPQGSPKLRASHRSRRCWCCWAHCLNRTPSKCRTPRVSCWKPTLVWSLHHPWHAPALCRFVCEGA